nr:hypothetical protein [Human alphaherpesvirus 1]AWO70415.1 hypothetical protein [Human alphaherpesvirus 1]AWO70438.1 hypothetical protein [Human alphaherpesvirus 1]AWW12103.1 hypothetical protein [Human alphaherpesvirus 1]AWW12991.1 hypothetical protein [Human alphaherpesvirus 1]
MFPVWSTRTTYAPMFPVSMSRMGRQSPVIVLFT